MAKSPKGMTERELVALLDRSITRSETYQDGEAAKLRRLSLQFLNGEIDIPAEKGKSSVVSHDMGDTLHWILPSLLRVFLGSENVGIYEPRRQEFVDEMTPEGPRKRDVSDERASQATDYVNYVLMNECRGYQVIHSALYEGLAFGNGLVKHWWDDTPEYETESFSALSDEAFTALVDDEDVEKVLEHTEYDDPDFVPPEMPSEEEMAQMAMQALQQGVPPEQIEATALQMQEAMIPPKLHDCKIKRKVSNGRLRVMALPHEEFFIGPSDLVIDEEETIVCGHSYRDTRSNLIAQGYARDKVKDLPAASETVTDETKTIRRGPIDEDERDWSTEEVHIHECYLKCDYDGDGIAERRKVVMGGFAGQFSVLENEEWGDDLPFTDLVPDPVPHRWRGRSLLDELADIMRIKTTVMRQTLDNLYHTNNPQVYTREGDIKNMDVLVNRELGGVIIGSKQAQTPPQTLAVPFVAKESFAMLEYLDMVKETRTGVSRQASGLDMDALQNQTATAVNAMQTAAYSKLETYARNIASMGMKRLFRCLLRLITKHQDRPRTIRLRGDWIEMNPQAWHAEMDVHINTGLGSGSRDKDLAMLTAILTEQKGIIAQAGPFNPICDVRKFRDTLAQMVEIAGLKSPERYFAEVSDEDMQDMQEQASGDDKPDPKMAEAQQKMQLEQMKAQAEAQRKQEEMQFEFQLQREKAEADLAAFREKAAMELQLARDKAAEELRMMQEKQDLQFQLRLREMEIEAQLKREKIYVEGMSPGAIPGQPTNIPRPQL